MTRPELVALIEEHEAIVSSLHKELKDMDKKETVE